MKGEFDDVFFFFKLTSTSSLIVRRKYVVVFRTLVQDAATNEPSRLGKQLRKERREGGNLYEGADSQLRLVSRVCSS